MALLKGKFVSKDEAIQSNSDPVANEDLSRKSYVDSVAAAAASDKLPLAGGTMSGILDMDSISIINLADPVNPGDAVHKNYVDDGLAGKADLVGGKVPSEQLPSYVDDVIEVADYASLPATGEADKIYITVDNNKVYRWSGSAYIEIVASPGSTDAVPEGSINLYFTNERAKTAAVSDSITDGVIDVAPSQNAVVDALALKQDSLGTGTTSQYLRGDLTWQTVVVPTLYQNNKEIYIDPALGIDAAGRGGQNNPYATINYAYSQVSLEAGDVTKWANEKIVFKLSPGIYSEDVSLGFKRRSIMIRGTGVKIMGKVTVTANRSDYPTTMSPLPYPWSTGFSSPTFEICGEGGGMEDGFTSDNIIVQGQVRVQFAGLINWSTQVGPHYVCITNCQLQGGIVGTYENVSGSPGFTVEIDSSSVDGGNIGVMPYIDGNTTTGILTLSLKAHNSQLKSTLGPKINILEIDGCRVVNIDRTYGGITNGLVTANNSTSYSGIVSSTFAGTTYKIGKASGTGTDTFKMDAMSYGSLKEKTIDNGTGTIAYNLVDKAAGVSVAAAAVNYTRASADVEAALVGIDTALAGKAALVHTHVAADITDFDSAAQSALTTQLAGKQDSLGTGTTSQYLRGDLTWAEVPAALMPKKEVFVLTSTDLSNAYLDCAHVAAADSMLLMTGGIPHQEGASEDYTLSTVGGVTRISINSGLLAKLSVGDRVYVMYQK